HIVSTAFEHHAVLHTLKKLEKEGFEITLLDVHKNGIITADEVKDAIRENTCLVTIMFANNEIGTIQPIAEIGAVCKEKGVLFHTDAVQAAGHIKIDVKEMNIDMLSLSAHKFHGPKGVGALYCRKGILLQNLIEGGAQERGKRAGTENLPAILGMAQAFDDACTNIDKNAEYLTALRNRLIEGLSEIEHSVVNGDTTNRLPGNVNICFEGIEGESLLLLLDMKGIQASSGSACTSGSLDPSHVLLAIGLPHEVAHGSLRLSLSEENTMDEVEYIINTVPEIVEYLRNMSPVWEALTKGEIEHVI
ncbi:MAG: aminotransferase class V-fold PLP-dependent enzyme, partial [Eubacterium sp.]|nr:aminotransferase class V-fold PLP-dependent enzyme [Eubacterium sp.]